MNFIKISFFIFLLWSGATFAQQSSLHRFLNGERLTYSSAGNTKAKGIEMSFDYELETIIYIDDRGYEKITTK
jgi:hypothetical protein